jgi:hypothetical protein
MQSPQQAFDQANAQYNIPQQNQQVQGLRQSVQNTQNLLSQIAPSVMGRTANSLVDNAQATRMIANEQAPLNATLSKENTDYANANQDYQNSLSEASQLANAELTGQSQKQSYLQGIYNDFYTQEQNAAQLAAEKYAADASARASTASQPDFSSLVSALGGGSTSGGMGAPSPFAKGTNINDAIAQMFKGYNPQTDQMYTEKQVLPSILDLFKLNNTGNRNLPSEADALNTVKNLVYTYRKNTFGE